MEVDDGAVLDEFAEKGSVTFSSTADRVKGDEATLEKSKIRIYLAMNADRAALASLGMNEIHVSLKWIAAPATSRIASHWLLSIVPPNTGDAVKDSNELKRMKDALHEHLVNVGIEFQAE